MTLELIRWLGIMCPLALGAIGSAIGYGISGSTLVGAMTKTKEGHGALIAMSAAPSSQIIYGLVLMRAMSEKTSATAGMLLAIGLLCGLAIMVSAIMQSKCCAAGIRATLEGKSVYGKCWIPVGVTESFAVFAMVFGMVALG